MRKTNEQKILTMSINWVEPQQYPLKLNLYLIKTINVSQISPKKSYPYLEIEKKKGKIFRLGRKKTDYLK